MTILLNISQIVNGVTFLSMVLRENFILLLETPNYVQKSERTNHIINM